MAYKRPQDPLKRALAYLVNELLRDPEIRAIIASYFKEED